MEIHSIPQFAVGRKPKRGLVTMLEKPPRYRSYLLTFWEERSQSPEVAAVWRFRLEDPRTGRRRGFANLEEVVAFIQTELAGDEGGSPGRGSK